MQSKYKVCIISELGSNLPITINLSFLFLCLDSDGIDYPMKCLFQSHPKRKISLNLLSLNLLSTFLAFLFLLGSWGNINLERKIMCTWVLLLFEECFQQLQFLMYHFLELFRIFKNMNCYKRIQKCKSAVVTWLFKHCAHHDFLVVKSPLPNVQSSEVFNELIHQLLPLSPIKP